MFLDYNTNATGILGHCTTLSCVINGSTNYIMNLWH